ncbi:methyltransferase-like protein 27 [Physella acuta]|uniref:methyltransferase-like protein 27 n=1 Tax=Physella acuta TaxID=109671 RepID=UPI0027DBE6F6|nr:methyltransferase-like protein 27 [Physella acuta]
MINGYPTTRQVGEELSRHGFENVHAHDGSCAMLDVCRRKKVYSKFICSVINDDTGLPVKNGFYDAVVTSGAVLENHLPVSALAEIIRVTKSGGFCIVAYSSDVLSTNYGKSWEKEMRRLEEDGLWSRHCKVLIPNFYINTRGVVDVLHVA